MNQLPIMTTTVVVEAQSRTPKPCHVAVISSPGMGHIIPLFELSKRLAADHGVHVSFLNITTQASAAQDQLLRSPDLPPNLHVIDLPHADVTSAVSAVPETQVLARLCVIVDENLKPLESVLRGMGDVSALVTDLFCTQAIEACEGLSIPVYTFVTTSAALFTFALYLPILDRKVDCEFVDLLGPVRVPGCSPIRTENLLDQVKNRKLDEYRWFLRHVSNLPKSAGIFLNTWEDLEPVPLRAIGEDRFYSETVKTPPVYPVGPLVKRSEPINEAGRECLTWLDRQPEGSVVFVALGSGGTLSSEQMEEVAWGLERSRQRFVWVVRPPADVASGAFFDAGKDVGDPASFLPEGFAERNEGRGFVVPMWAPQVAVLGHVATGAFLSHCGWNSTLESAVAGVAVIAWPLYAEQRMNAAALTEDVGAAVWPEVDPTRGVVTRDEVERVVRMVIEGEEGKGMRLRAKDLKESAAVALGCDGGSSYESLARVVQQLKLLY